MKIALLMILTIGLVFGLGFLMGNLSGGHHFSISSEEIIPFEKGELKRVYGHDYCGFELMDPGASWIEFKGNHAYGIQVLYSRAS